MPMLDRAAATATAEACQLQRVLVQSTKTGNKLRKGFWQHGAHAFDAKGLSPSAPPASSSRSRRPATEQSADDVLEQPPRTELNASAFLLDFLYPNVSLETLQRKYPRLPRRRHAPVPKLGSRGRYSSSSSSEAMSVPVVGTTMAETNGTAAVTDPEVERTGTPLEYSSEGRDGHGHPDPADSPGTPRAKKAAPRHLTVEETLESLLSQPDGRHFLDVWDTFRQLDLTKQASFCPRVVVYLAQSRSIVETQRCMTIMDQVSPDKWNNAFVAATILVHMRSGNFDMAVKRFKAAVRSKGITDGLEYLLSDCVVNFRFQQTVDIWVAYAEILFTRGEPLSTDVLNRLHDLPKLGDSYFAFEKWIASLDQKPETRLDRLLLTNPNITILRRKWAELALEQACPPRQASIILAAEGDPKLYDDYLLRMFRRWENGQETAISLTGLVGIYNSYRKLTGFKPSNELYRGLFNLHYPYNVRHLESLLKLWQSDLGELDEWAFRKFLAHFSRQANVSATLKLWQRYVKRYPEAVLQPSGFRSLLNVYAQCGDVVKTQQVLTDMSDEYGVTPDIDSWNTLLKCAVRTDDYELVTRIFDEIRRLHQPDAWTYTHAMAMSAKRGDLASTLSYFEQSQQQDVTPSPTMVLPLVTVYCRNDQLEAAQNICTELAQRGITSTNAWNELIRCYGTHAKLSHCYDLLHIMKSFGVEWNAETYTCLFQAMTHSGQIHAAYRLLNNALKYQLFVVEPEHYTTVMMGAMEKNQSRVAQYIKRLLVEAGHVLPFNAHVAYGVAAHRSSTVPSGIREAAQDIVGSFEKLVSAHMILDKGDDGESGTGVRGNRRTLTRETEGAGRALKFLLDVGERQLAEEFAGLCIDFFGCLNRSGELPQSVLSALMLSFLIQNELAQVHELWNENLTQLLATARQPGGSIYPAKQYALCRPMNIVVKAFAKAEDGIGLRRCVQSVVDAGFKFTSANWNHIIQNLCLFGQWQSAMTWCEDLLMPRWRGWDPHQLKKSDRRELRNTRILWPNFVTVQTLQKNWLNLRRLAAWSPQMSVQIANVESQYPKLYHAFTTSELGEVPQQWTLSGKKDLKGAIDDFLKMRSPAELSRMKRVLHHQLRQTEKAGYLPRGMNSFVRRTPKEGSEAKTVREFLTSDQLEILGASVETRLGQLFNTKLGKKAANVAANKARIRVSAEVAREEGPVAGIKAGSIAAAKAAAHAGARAGKKALVQAEGQAVVQADGQADGQAEGRTGSNSGNVGLEQAPRKAPQGRLPVSAADRAVDEAYEARIAAYGERVQRFGKAGSGAAYNASLKNKISAYERAAVTNANSAGAPIKGRNMNLSPGEFTKKFTAQKAGGGGDSRPKKTSTRTETDPSRET